jgi:hypothetical protein
MKLLFRFPAILIIILSSVSCGDSYDSPNPYPGGNTTTFKATLNGDNERPDPVTTSATGIATLTFNNTSKMFSLTGTYTGIAAADVTLAHIHGPAATTAIANPLFSLTVTPTTSYDYGTISYTSTIALTTAQETDLKNGLYYVNIHSTAHPAGEIRGQLIKQ